MHGKSEICIRKVRQESVSHPDAGAIALIDGLEASLTTTCSILSEFTGHDHTIKIQEKP